jgi:hypothetical protein
LVVGQKREALFNCSRVAADHPQQTLRNHPVADLLGYVEISTQMGDLATLFGHRMTITVMPDFG